MRFVSLVSSIRVRRAWLLLGAFLGVVLLAMLVNLHAGRSHRQAARETVFFPKGEEAYLAGDYDAAIGWFLKSIDSEPRDARPYYRLVDSYAEKGNLEEAETILRSMLAGDPRNARAHYGLGCIAMKRQDLETARAEAERARALDSRFGYARLILGSVHNLSGRPREALKMWRTARRLFLGEGDREGETWALNRMALVHRQMGEFHTALGEFEEAVEIQRMLGDRGTELVVLGNLGLTQADLGDIERATVSFGAALVLSREVGDRWYESWLLTNISFLHNLTGEYHRAIDYADSAVVLARSIPDPIGEISGLVNCATASTDLGDPIRAIEVCRRALELADSLVDVRHRASVLLAMGNAHLDLGRMERARRSFTRSDSLFRQIDLRAGSWSALIGLCEVALREGDTAYAVTEAERTMEQFRRAGYAEGEEFIALRLSDLAIRRGDAGLALGLAGRALELSRRDGRRAREAMARARRAQAYLAMGAREEAEAEAQQARTVAVKIRSPEVLWFCEMVAGDVRSRSDAETALRHYEEAMEAVEAIQRNLRLDEFKAGYLENRVDLYFKTADLLVNLGRIEEALATCERSRARALHDFLAASPVPVSPRVPENLARRLHEIEGHLRTLRTTLAGFAASGQDPARMRALEREIASAKEEWAEVCSRVLLEDPRYGAVVADAPLPGARQILDALGANEALVEYFLGRRTSLCFVGRNGELHALRLPMGADHLARQIETLRRPLLTAASLASLVYDLSIAVRLREQILDPILPLLEGADRLIVVPDGPLHCFPLEALVLQPGEGWPSDTLHAALRRTRFVGERYAIRYLPSAGLLVADGSAGAGVPMMGRRAEESPAGSIAPSTLLAYGDPGGGGLPGSRRLRFSEQEIRAIARVFPDPTVRLGSDATEQSFKILAPRYRCVHLASHGTADVSVPLYSALALAPDRDGADDGTLHAYEILGIPLRCDLVTLSACETGLGRLYAGEGLLGLTRSLLYAGARQAVVSLWSVDDASTARLMERFYANLARGLEAAEALQDAKRALKESVTRGLDGRPLAYAHPFFWAPFVLIGAPAGR